MPKEIQTVSNSDLEKAKRRAIARGGTIEKEEKTDAGHTKLTIDYPPV